MQMYIFDANKCIKKEPTYFLILHTFSKKFGRIGVKFGYSKKATKFEKIFHLKFDVTQQCQRSIFQTFWKPDFGTRFLFFKLGI